MRDEARELDAEQARRKEALAHALDVGDQVALADVADATGLQLKQGRLAARRRRRSSAPFGVHKDAKLGVQVDPARRRAAQPRRARRCAPSPPAACAASARCPASAAAWPSITATATSRSWLTRRHPLRRR